MGTLKRATPWIPLAVAVLIVGLGVAVDRYELPGRAYYLTVAQIIPVLIVALAVELKDRADRGSVWYKAQLFVLLLGGEAAALLGASGALGGHPEGDEGLVANTPQLSDWLAAVTSAGMVGGFLAVVLVAVLGADAISGGSEGS